MVDSLHPAVLVLNGSIETVNELVLKPYTIIPFAGSVVSGNWRVNGRRSVGRKAFFGSFEILRDALKLQAD